MQLNPQRGGTLMGFILGLVLGLGVALAVAVYVTKVPTPFSNKNQTRTSDQEAKENEKNKDWNPNSVLQAKPPAEVPSAAGKPVAEPGAENAATANATSNTTAAPATPNAPTVTPVKPAADAKAEPRPAVTTDPLMDLAKSKSALSTPADAASSADQFEYVLQVGAFRTNADADSQKAKLAAMGLDAKVSERDQAGRSVFRVRLGPFADKAAAEKVRTRLESSGIENTLVRVQR